LNSCDRFRRGWETRASLARGLDLRGLPYPSREELNPLDAGLPDLA
jgi:hypothetical protein